MRGHSPALVADSPSSPRGRGRQLRRGALARKRGEKLAATQALEHNIEHRMTSCTNHQHLRVKVIHVVHVVHVVHVHTCMHMYVMYVLNVVHMYVCTCTVCMRSFA